MVLVVSVVVVVVVMVVMVETVGGAVKVKECEVVVVPGKVVIWFAF